MITQISRQSSSFPEPLKTLYSRCESGKRPPTYGDLIEVLENVIVGLQHTYIILDALDECQSAERKRLSALISRITKLGNLHLLVTSRKEQDIEEWLGPIVTRQIDLTDTINTDIEQYIQGTLQNDPKWKYWNDWEGGMIETTLKKGANGM